MFEKKLIKKNLLDSDKKKIIVKEIEDKVFPIIDDVLSKSYNISSEENEISDVYAESHEMVYEKYNKNNLSNLRYIDAIKYGLYGKLESDSKVILMGQDIAEYGGVFKVTEGFLSKFGKDRIRNTPITESSVIGASMGLAISGYKPIVEMQFADFVSDGFNQIVNNLAKTHYRWGQSINVTLRLPTGGAIGAGPFHSQNTEAWFFHVPGLKIVYPSSPYDAKGLLISSIDDPNPVLFFEHKYLYRSMKGSVPDDQYAIEIGKAKLVRQGKDLSIISYGLGVKWALDYCVDSLYDIEVLDLRTLLPLDVESIYKTVEKTNKVIVLHEDNITGGIGSEISSLITENCFDFLDAPILRLGSIDTPVPSSSNIEEDIFLPINKIDSAVNKLMKY